MEQLEGKVAVVTGGGSGIGEGIIGACVEAGMRVVVADIDLGEAERVASAARESGADALAVQVDVSDRTAMDVLAERAYEEFGEVNLLFCNAGVIIEASIEDSTDADWDWLFRVNVMGVVHGAQAFVPRMREQEGEAHIVNTGSIAGIFVPPLDIGTYAASKHAVIAISDRLRHEVADDGIGVSVLCPGGVVTRLFEGHRNVPADLADSVTPAQRSEGSGGISPALAGKLVLDAVRAGRFWVITHPRAADRALLDTRYEELRAAYEWALERS